MIETRKVALRSTEQRYQEGHYRCVEETVFVKFWEIKHWDTVN